jgi:hypothetical protein
MKLIHICDILAIPFFIILIIYFSLIQNKSYVEYSLLLFGISGLLVDSFFTYKYVIKK